MVAYILRTVIIVIPLSAAGVFLVSIRTDFSYSCILCGVWFVLCRGKMLPGRVVSCVALKYGLLGE